MSVPAPLALKPLRGVKVPGSVLIPPALATRGLLLKSESGSELGSSKRSSSVESADSSLRFLLGPFALLGFVREAGLALLSRGPGDITPLTP